MLGKAGEGTYGVVFKARGRLRVARGAGGEEDATRDDRSRFTHAHARAQAASKRDPSRLVAIKEMRHDEQEEGVPSSALREISLLLELSHPNVVRCSPLAHALTQQAAQLRPHALVHAAAWGRGAPAAHASATTPCSRVCAAPRRRLHEVYNDLRLHRLYLVFEFLDVDLYRLMQANPLAFRSEERLVKVRATHLERPSKPCRRRWSCVGKGAA